MSQLVLQFGGIELLNGLVAAIGKVYDHCWNALLLDGRMFVCHSVEPSKYKFRGMQFHSKLLIVLEQVNTFLADAGISVEEHCGGPSRLLNELFDGVANKLLNNSILLLGDGI